jgi:exopolysaccharide production protein ExoQ
MIAQKKPKPLLVATETLLIGLLLLYSLGMKQALPQAVDTMVNLLSYVTFIPLIFWRWKALAYTLTRDPFPVILVSIATLSFLWSANPSATLIELRPLFRAMFLGAYMAARYSSKDQMKIFAWAIGAIAILSIPSAIQGNIEWGNILYFKNLFSCLMGLGTLLFMLISISDKRNRLISIIMLVISFSFLILSQGKTSLSALLISLCIFPLYQLVKQNYKIRVAIFLAILMIAGSSIILIFNNIEFIVVDTLGKNLEFNGRVPIWTLMFDKIWEHPILGYGYVGFWSSENALYVVDNSWASSDREVRFNAHSGYIDLLLQLGFAGLFMYILHIFTILKRVIHLFILDRSIEYLWMLLYLVFVLLVNFSDSFGAVSSSGLWTMSVAIAFSSSLEASKIKVRRFTDKG